MEMACEEVEVHPSGSVAALSKPRVSVAADSPRVLV